MRIPRYYIDQALNCDEQLPLPEELHRHAVQVLRGKVDDALILFNGQGGEYHAHCTEVNKRNSTVLITKHDEIDRESPLEITLVLALIKSDKFDFALQKAVEMGVTRVQPVIAARSVLNLKGNRLEKKAAHWLGVIHAACEQSGRTRVPELLNALPFNDYLMQTDDTLRLAMLPTAKESLETLEKPSLPISLLVGPEGGFREDEVELMQQQGVQTILFGPRILRAETAVIAGIALCQSYWGDL